MDPHNAPASKEDIWRLQSDMKSVYAVQAEHADRLLRLERRYDDDGRTKSVWGTMSSFPSVRGGTPHQDPNYNPAAEAFKNFDQDNSSTLLGSLHIDTDDEPRRGASRANSVRFDESALHGQLGHTSRSSSEFFPLHRTGSGFGSHPLTERSSSHKSEGRQSSAGLSTHSTGINGLGFDQQTQNTLVDLQPRPAPGLILLGPHPSIIRCWLGTRFTNDSLRYVALNTGASRSTIARSWLHELSLQDQVYREGHDFKIKLQISLPEAAIQQPSAGTQSPSIQLPAITATLTVFDIVAEEGMIQCFLGSDVLRTRNADILFSQDRLTLYDDQHNKVIVPLVRPEQASIYERLSTTNAPANVEWRGPSHQLAEPRSAAELSEEAPPATAPIRSKPAYSRLDPRLDWSRVRQGRSGSPTGSGHTSPPVRDSDSDAAWNTKREQPSSLHSKSAAEPEVAITSPQPNTPLSAEPSESWSSWRKDSTGRDSRKETTFSSVASSTGQRTASQGKGMKVLKARRMSSNRSVSTTDPASRPEPSPSMWGATSPAEAGNHVDSDAIRLTDAQRRSYSNDLKSVFGGSGGGGGGGGSSTATTRPTNPVGGASAFGWLNPSQAR